MITTQHYEVRLTVSLPDGVEATKQEVEAWLRFAMRDTCSLSNDNPLIDHDPQPLRGTFRVSPAAAHGLQTPAAKQVRTAAAASSSEVVPPVVPPRTNRLRPVGAGDGNTFVVG